MWSDKDLITCRMGKIEPGILEAQGFEHIRLGFDQHNLRTMELIDNFGHTTRLEFSHVQRNPQLAPTLFEFTPPAGVDVIGE